MNFHRDDTLTLEADLFVSWYLSVLFVLLILFWVQIVTFLMEALFTRYLLIHILLLHEIPPKQICGSDSGYIKFRFTPFHGIASVRQNGACRIRNFTFVWVNRNRVEGLKFTV